MTITSPPQSVHASENWLKDILKSSNLADNDQISYPKPEKTAYVSYAKAPGFYAVKPVAQ